MRIRTIKPEFWTDGKIVSLTPVARLLFIGLWNAADDFGLMKWQPIELKMRLLPADKDDIEDLVDELLKQDLVRKYKVREDWFLEVKNFLMHQKIDKRLKPRLPEPRPGFYDAVAPIDKQTGRRMKIPDELKHPETPASREQTRDSADKPGHPPTNALEGKGREGKGEEGSAEGELSLEHEEENSGSIALQEVAFEEFWSLFPKKVGKGAARKSFKKLKCHLKLQKIRAAIEAAKATKGWTEEKGKFIPNPATWLNQERWDDGGIDPDFEKKAAPPTTTPRWDGHGGTE